MGTSRRIPAPCWVLAALLPAAPGGPRVPQIRRIIPPIVRLPPRPAERPASEHPQPAANRTVADPWTIDDLILAESASDWTISPDGSLAAG